MFSTSPLNSIDHAEFEGARSLVLQAVTLVWVSTRGSVDACRPRATLIQGLMMAITIERPTTKYTLVDSDPHIDQYAMDIAQAVIQKESSLFQATSTKFKDTEYIMSEGCLNISRRIPDRTEMSYSGIAKVSVN